MSWVSNVMVSVHSHDCRNVEALSEWLRTEAPLRDGRRGGCGYLTEITGDDTAWGGWKFPECDVWAGALDHADLKAVLEHIARLPWRCPNALQVFVMDQEEEYFRVWMLRDGAAAVRAGHARRGGPGFLPRVDRLGPVGMTADA